MDYLYSSLRIIGCLSLATLFTLLIDPSYAKAPDYPDTEKLLTVGGSAVMSNVPPCGLYFLSQASLSDNQGNYSDIIIRYDWNSKKAKQIMFCESSNNPNEHRFSHKTRDDSWGLFQINLYGNLSKNRPSAEWLKVPENNIAYAYQLYSEFGWSPWMNCRDKINL